MAPKSRKGTRTAPLPAPLMATLGAHRAAQAAEQLAAGSLWERPPAKGRLQSGTGFVFASPVGKPIDPRKDWQAWKDLLEEAGVRDARLCIRAFCAICRTGSDRLILPDPSCRRTGKVPLR